MLIVYSNPKGPTHQSAIRTDNYVSRKRHTLYGFLRKQLLNRYTKYNLIFNKSWIVRSPLCHEQEKCKVFKMLIF